MIPGIRHRALEVYYYYYYYYYYYQLPRNKPSSGPVLKSQALIHLTLPTIVQSQASPSSRN